MGCLLGEHRGEVVGRPPGMDGEEEEEQWKRGEGSRRKRLSHSSDGLQRPVSLCLLSGQAHLTCRW